MSNNTTIFRLLKVPKYAKRVTASMCERKSRALEEEMGRLQKDWMEKEREIAWLRRELERVKGELRAEKGGQVQWKGPRLSKKEADELDALWTCLGR